MARKFSGSFKNPEKLLGSGGKPRILIPSQKGQCRGRRTHQQEKTRLIGKKKEKKRSSYQLHHPVICLETKGDNKKNIREREK